tara:strand:+ start:320 stop:505 length:186 start_codon:yes stop_codon:yes gene_type:complete
MDLPKVYPITSDALTSKELLNSVRRLASTKITIFQYRRKSLHESEAEKNGAYGVAGISIFW